jgi:glycosyltransferase involved in cell wall biosynthesis
MLSTARKFTGTSGYRAEFSVDERTVAVIIPTFNHARFLVEAIKSVLAQTRQADEIIVVDDGSTDDPAIVVAEFPTVQFIRQDNKGPSSARNVGIRNCKTDYVVFLDADDRLLPNGLESGLACMAIHPECAFVYGAHRVISEDGRFLWGFIVRPIEGDVHLAFLRRNLVGGSPLTALFRRDCLMAVNGFDESLRKCEDYDLYLRLAGKYPIVAYRTIIGEYRKHGQNTTNDYLAMLKGALLVLDLDQARITSKAHRAARREGRAHFRSYYVSWMLKETSARWRARRDIAALVTDLAQAAHWAPYFTICTLGNRLGRRARKVLCGS